jgi:hypothetical protein
MSHDTLALEAGLIARPPPRPDDVRCFKGLPYAAPVAPWSGAGSVDVFGPA